MEKRVLIAALLSALFLTLYSNVFMRGTKPGTVPPIQSPKMSPEISSEPVRSQRIENENVLIVESNELRAGIGEESGSIKWVEMRQFFDASGTKPLRFEGTEPVFSARIGEPFARYQLLSSSPDRVVLEATDENGYNYHISYSIQHDNSLINIELSKLNESTNNKNEPVILTGSLLKADKSSNSHNILEAMVLLHGSNGKTSYKKHAAPVKNRINVPRGTTLVSIAEKYFSFCLRSNSGELDTAILPSPNGSISVESRAAMEPAQGGGLRFSATMYLGPRDYFYLKKSGFSDAFPIGVIGQIGLIFLLILKSIASVIKSYGFAIIIFSSLITLVLSPLTIVSVRSMKKMQELKPKIDRVTAQHKGDQTKTNQAVFALYKEHKISPMSGCLPMLLQMPIFIALFQAMSHFIEFRGKSFLWMRDLSLPDRIFQLPFSIPILGSDINLLPIIMAVAMFFQTKLSQQSSGVGETNPTAKMMSGPLMPIMFCFMFYGFPSGLVLYWLTNSLLSIMVYRIAK